MFQRKKTLSSSVDLMHLILHRNGADFEEQTISVPDWLDNVDPGTQQWVRRRKILEKVKNPEGVGYLDAVEKF